MHLSFSQVNIGPEFDKKIKLTPRQKKEIIALRKQGMRLIDIAEQYGVSESYVSLLTRPAALNEVKVRSKKNKKKYYNKEKVREYMKNYRHHKRELLNQGLLETEFNPEVATVGEYVEDEGVTK